MAEDVQFVMDSMVPALRDFVKYGLFKEYEVKSLINKRREFEYLLRRMSVRKSDYLLYLTYEFNLNKLFTL
eukprot:CAMPEP_0197556064 /NCGR_PEP_ID=MMETSP1320-20131121/14508_1 /TAXON_ID=91990 /ORGANISM="Bolidomonas sp., Strain RCC2347" /LENGTH=70 /DNA_ID=CAMNT_0043117155 /DNA_START=158 /DNA_END=366 /DNA_ORIENTATION=-